MHINGASRYPMYHAQDPHDTPLKTERYCHNCQRIQVHRRTLSGFRIVYQCVVCDSITPRPGDDITPED